MDSTLATAVLVSAAAVAAATDMMRFKVYNLLTIPLALLALAYHWNLFGWSGLLTSLSGMGLALVLLLLPYALGMLGAGDVKFVAALGAWLGPRPLMLLMVLGALTTGAFAAIIVVRRSGWRGVLVDLRLAISRVSRLLGGLWREDRIEPVQAVVQQEDRRHRLVPFSAMMTIALFAVLLLRALYMESLMP